MNYRQHALMRSAAAYRHGVVCAVRALGFVATAGAQTGQSNPERNVHFGDLHLHTSNSLDAALMTTATPDDAYRYAKGEAIARSGGQTIQLERPLDFLAITDHAEYLGLQIGEYCSRLCAIEGFAGHKEQADLRVLRYGHLKEPAHR